MKKKIAVVCFSFLMLLVQIFGVRVVASEKTTVNLNDLPIFKNRTIDDVATEYYKVLKPEYYNSKMTLEKYPIFKSNNEPSIASPYRAGEMEERVHHSMTDMANYYRWLVGVEKFRLGPSVHSDSLQTMAVLEYLYFRDTNQLSHTLYRDFRRPQDMDEAFWNKGSNVSHNIVAGGYFPQKSIEGFFYEGYNLKTKRFDTIGHRWTLLSKLATNGFNFAYTNGIVIGSYKNNSSGNGTTDMPIVAFPAPGYNPDRIADGKITSWSFELGTYRLPVTNSAKGVSVTVENLTTHESYVATEEKGNLICQYETNIVYQQPEPTRGNYYDGSYKITINGLLDENNQPKTIEYTTTFVDVSYKGNSIPTSVFDIEFKDLAKGLYNGQLNQKAYPLYRQPSFGRTGSSVTANYVSQTLPELELTTTTGFKQNLLVTFDLFKDDNNGMTLRVIDYNKSSLDVNINDDLRILSNYQPVLSNLFFEMVDVNQTGDEGKVFKIVFKPTSSDYVPVKIVWYKVDGNDKVSKVGEGNELVFDKLSLTDAGKYFFTAFDDQRGYMVMKYSAVKNLIVRPKTVKTVTLIGFDKLTYLDGEDLDLSNAKYDIVYSDDSVAQIPVERTTVTGYNTDKIGQQNITFTYSGKSIKKTVIVEPREVSSISVNSEMTKKSYSQGEDINPEGLSLSVTYTNQTHGNVNVTRDMISDYDKDKVGNQSILITYRGHTLRYDVTVIENAARALEIAKAEAKKTIDGVKELTSDQKKKAKLAVDNAKNNDELSAVLKEVEKQKKDKIILEESRARALALAKKYGAFFDNDIRLARNLEELEAGLKDSLKYSSKGINKFYADRKAEIDRIEKQIRELPNLDDLAKNKFVEQLKSTLLSGDLEQALKDAQKESTKVPASIITPIPNIDTTNIIKEIIYKGEVIDLSDNISDLPNGSVIVDVTLPAIDTNIVGSYIGKAKVIFSSGASKIVNIPIEIKDKVQPEVVPTPSNKVDTITKQDVTNNVGVSGKLIDVTDITGVELVVEPLSTATFNKERLEKVVLNGKTISELYDLEHISGYEIHFIKDGERIFIPGTYSVKFPVNQKVVIVHLLENGNVEIKELEPSEEGTVIFDGITSFSPFVLLSDDHKKTIPIDNNNSGGGEVVDNTPHPGNEADKDNAIKPGVGNVIDVLEGETGLNSALEPEKDNQSTTKNIVKATSEKIKDVDSKNIANKTNDSVATNSDTKTQNSETNKVTDSGLHTIESGSKEISRNYNIYIITFIIFLPILIILLFFLKNRKQK